MTFPFAGADAFRTLLIAFLCAIRFHYVRQDEECN